MSTDLRHRLGRAGEALAAQHLERRGFRILVRNHRTRYGEIDLIAYDGRTLVFAEVKSRRAGSGTPWDALTESKCRQVRQMAKSWLAQTSPERPRAAELRFDAIGVVIDARGRLVRLDHLEAAF
jgi:putative endonuclease